VKQDAKTCVQCEHEHETARATELIRERDEWIESYAELVHKFDRVALERDEWKRKAQ
jgi:hypothetical protein